MRSISITATSTLGGRLSRGFRTSSALKDQARGRAMREQAPLAIRDPSFGGADAPAPAQHDAFRPDHTCFRDDRPQQGNLELERGLADALLQGRLDGQSHAAVEQRGREAAVHGARWIEMNVP